MATNLNTSELLQVLDSTPDDQNLLLVGKHGIGKSEILTQYFEQKGMRVQTLFLGQMSDPGDLIGLPCRNEVTGRTEFLPPFWFPVDGQPIVLFLDELNRARPEVLQTIMDLALNRRLADHSLPEGSRIISAVNSGEEYTLTELDPALVSRFNVYHFVPTAEEWLLWATQQGVDHRVLEFIADHPDMLDGDGKDLVDRGLEKSPDRRAWKKASDILLPIEHLGNVHKKLLAGIVGSAATASFFTSLGKRNLLSGKDVLLAWDKHKEAFAKYAIHQKALVNESIFRFLETKQYAPKDKPQVVAGLGLYVKALASGKTKEAMGHFVSIFEKRTYPTAMKFILVESPEVYDLITRFIEKL